MDTMNCMRSSPEIPGAAPELALAAFGADTELSGTLSRPSLPHAAISVPSRLFRPDVSSGVRSTAPRCHATRAQAFDLFSALCQQPPPTPVTSTVALPVPTRVAREQNLVPVYNMPLSSPIQSQMMPVDWPPVAALDLAQSPHGLGSANALDHLGAQAPQQHQHQHLPGGYSWGGLWLDTNLDHDLGAPEDHARQLNYTDPILSSHVVHQPPSYFEHPMGTVYHHTMVESPTIDLDYSQGEIDPARRATVSSASTDTSLVSSTERKPRTQRERNRLAAHKCRQKSKVNADELQKQERELAEKHRCLTQHIQLLRNEVLDLKNEILRHGACGSELIEEYIAKAAQSLP